MEFLFGQLEAYPSEPVSRLFCSVHEGKGGLVGEGERGLFVGPAGEVG